MFTSRKTAARHKPEKTPLLREAAMPEEIAGAAAFPCSDDARFITGPNLVADGGHTCT